MLIFFFYIFLNSFCELYYILFWQKIFLKCFTTHLWQEGRLYSVGFIIFFVYFSYPRVRKNLFQTIMASQSFVLIFPKQFFNQVLKFRSQHFSLRKPYFTMHYMVLCILRRKGWIIKGRATNHQLEKENS